MLEQLHIICVLPYLRPNPKAASKIGSPSPSGFGRKREGLKSVGFLYTLSSNDIPLRYP